MIILTDSAVKKIQYQLGKRGKGIGIRIGVKTTGCSGLAYVLEYVDDTTDGDELISADGFSVVINQQHLPYLKGLTVNYTRNGLNEGFEFLNPNERDRCGCGESFRI
jgi:iron-sulfur cluster assembly protein